MYVSQRKPLPICNFVQNAQVMAKKIVDEQIKLSIVIDGNEGQKELYDLEKSTRDLSAANKELLAEKKKLEKQGKQESEAYKNASATIRQNNQVIKENKARMSELQNQIGLTGLTMNQLKSKALQLRFTLLNLVPGSADYIKYQNDLKQVTARMDELRGKAQLTGMTIGTVADKFNRYAALATSLVVALTGVVLSIQQVLDYNGKLSDSQSDVMKTTGMTKKEVDELTKSFGLFKTRTARIELLKLAEEGGRLGIEGTENIKKWVNVANQLKVALGDDLSETQIREVGKMVKVYRVGEETGRDFEGAMLSLGSAINEVSASGSNQAGYLVDYLKRTGGIAQQANLASANNLGYAATFDEIGQSVEVAGTAMNKVMMDMFVKPGDYAKIAKMKVSDFTTLLKTDFNAAMIAFLKGLEGNEVGLDVLIKKMDELDAGGVRGVQAITGLASNLDILEQRQTTSNMAMIEATSLTDEYNIKNNNLAATLDKIKKTVVGWYSSETFVQWLTDGVAWFAKFIGATEDTDGKMAKFKNGLMITIKVFAVLLAAMVTNVAWQKLVALWTARNTEATLLYNVATKGRAFAENLAKIGTLSYIAVTSLFTGNLKTAALATRGLTVALASTPWGAVLALVAAVTTAIVLFTKTSNEATWAQKELAKAQSDATVEIKKEENGLKNLIRVASDETRSKEQREATIKKINEISPEYLGNITLENIKTKETTKAVNDYIQALNKKLKLQAVERTLEATYDKEKELKSKDKSDYTKWYDYLMNGWYDIDQTAEDRKNEELRELYEDRVSLMYEMEQMMTQDPSVVPENKTPTDSGGFTPPKDKTKKTKKDTEANKQTREHEKRLEEIKKFHEDKLKLQREFEDGNYALMEDGYAKEKSILETQHQRKVEDLRSKLIKEEEIEKAQNQSKNEKLTEAQRKSYADLANAWLSTNSEIHKKIEQETDLHHIKLATLVEKFSVSEIDLLKKKYESDKIARETDFNKQLAALGTNERAREKLKKKFDKAEIDAEQKHLENLLAVYNQMMAGGTMNGIDFSLLSNEDAKKLQDNIAIVSQAISELLAKKTALKSGSEKPLGNGEDPLGLGQTDVLGFSQDQWTIFLDNIKNGTIGIETMGVAVMAMQNIWAQYGQMVEAGENRRLKQYETSANKKERRLKSQLDRGLINQDQYTKAVETVEADYNKKKAEIEYNQAKRKKKMDLVAAITSTAMAVLNGLNTQPFFPLGIAMSALAGIMGGLQIATIAKQPLPSISGYEQGLYGDHLVKREQDGKVFKTTYGGKTRSGVVNKNTMYMVGENGPEMVIDNKAFRKMNPQLRDSLIRELRGIKGFENGYYNPQSMQMAIPETDNLSNGELVAALIQLTRVLDNIEKNGLDARVSNKDLRSMKNVRDGIKNFENFRNRNKVS